MEEALAAAAEGIAKRFPEYQSDRENSAPFHESVIKEVHIT